MFCTLFTHLRPCPSLQYVFAPLVQFNEDETLWPPCGGCGLGQSHQLHRRACVLIMFVPKTVVVVQPQQALQATVACSDLHGIAGPKHVRPPSPSRNAPLSPALTLSLAAHFSLQMAINRWSSRTLTWIPTCSTECALYIRTRDGLHTRCSRCGLLVLTIRPQCCMMIRFHFLHPHFAPSPARSVTRDLQPAPQPLGPQEWDVPKKITATGQLSIRCVQSINNGGSSRGCLISEVNDMQQRACLRCAGLYCVLLLRQPPPSVVSPVLSMRFFYRFGSFP